MIAVKLCRYAFIAALAVTYIKSASAQTIGYAVAIDRLAVSCGNDIDKFCKKTDLGGGRVLQCLDQNQAGVSPACRSASIEVRTLLQRRALARAAVLRVCDVDIRRLCSGVQAGDGNLLECFFKTKQSVSSKCRRAVADAGYEVALAPASAPGPINLTSSEMINSLQAVEATASNISAARLRQILTQSLNQAADTTRLSRDPLFAQLNKLAQFTIAVQFDFDAARIRPDSFRAVGLMADALYHPYLQGYKFLIVGHTDGKGSREYNLRLSQQRADSIRAALINPFGIAPSRIEAVGFGKEQLLNPNNPSAAENRRVQLINIGR